MDEIVEVDPVGMKKLGNGLHVNFHRSAYDLVNECEVAKIGITDAVKVEWNGHIDTEEEIGRESTADILTRDLKKKDEERDKLISFIFMLIRGYRLSPETAQAEAAEKLQLVVKPYGKLQREAFRDETAHTIGLLKDLKKTENAALLTTLGLSSAVTKLEAANDAFHALSLQTLKSVHRKELPTAAEVRPKTDAVYDRIIFMIRAAYLSGATPVDREEIKKLVHHLNALVDKTNTAHHQSLAQKKAAKKKDPKDPKEPKTPKEPKIPKDPKQPKDPKEPKPQPDPKPTPDPKPQPDPKPKPKPGDDEGDDVYIPSV